MIQAFWKIFRLLFYIGALVGIGYGIFFLARGSLFPQAHVASSWAVFSLDTKCRAAGGVPRNLTEDPRATVKWLVDSGFLDSREASKILSGIGNARLRYYGIDRGWRHATKKNNP